MKETKADELKRLWGQFVDKEELGKIMEEADLMGMSLDEILSLIEDCPRSPAKMIELEIAVLGKLQEAKSGDSWVLEELKKRIAKDKKDDKKMGLDASVGTLECVEMILEDLESQVPVSDLEQKAKENKRKAELLKSLEEEIQKMSDIGVLEKCDKELKTWAKVLIRFIKRRNGELLAQSEEKQ